MVSVIFFWGLVIGFSRFCVDFQDAWSGRLHLLLEHLPGCRVFLYPGRVSDLDFGRIPPFLLFTYGTQMKLGVSQFRLGSADTRNVTYTTHVYL